MRCEIGKKICVALVLIGISLCGVGNILASALTYQTVEDVEFTFNPTLSVTLSDSDLIIDNLTPSSSSDSNIITVGIATNAGYGYYMSATVGTSSGNTNLTNTTTSSAIFTSLASNAASLNAFPDNNWGYSYSTDDGTTWISGSQGSTSTGYNGLPLDNDDSGATGVVLTSANSFSNSSSIKFKIGAKAAATQATGIYTNTVNFYAIANPEPSLAPVACTAGRICYNVNSLSATEGTMGQQSAADGNTVTLLASNFSRTGYGFAGWNTSYDYSGTFYGPQEDITVPTGTTANGYSLYAVWVKSAGTLQSDANRVCNGLTKAPTDGTANLSSVSALTDARDNQTYAIAKLADGKCWMIENLRLEAENTRTAEKQALAQGYGTSTTYGNFGGLADAESTGFTDNYSANSLYSNDGSNNTINIGTSNYPGYRIPRYNNLNTQSRASSPASSWLPEDNTTGGMYSYGNYYTWHAAIADTAHYASGSRYTTSLCPAGWRLPIGGRSTVDNSFGALSVILGGPAGGTEANTNSTPTGTALSKIFRSYPNNFLLSGYFKNSSTYARGTGSMYWSSTAGPNLDYARSLEISQGIVDPGEPENKSHGLSIRCMAEETVPIPTD